MRNRENLGLLTIACVLLLIPSCLAVAKVLPGPAIVAHAEGSKDGVNWSASVTVCKGKAVYLSAVGPVTPECLESHKKKPCLCSWSYDLDYESDPHTFCAGVGFTWKYTKNGVEHYLGHDAAITTSFDEVGSYVCVVTVSDGEPPDGNDGDATASVTVDVREIEDMTGPDQCVLCVNKNYTWNVDVCCPNDVEWHAYSALPSFQSGGCSFTTMFIWPGEGRYVTANCGSSQESKGPYTIEAGCDVESEPPLCQLLFEYIGQIPQPPYGCTMGDTAWYPGGGWPVVCFDCPSREEWVVKVTGQLELDAIITNDPVGHQEDDGTCDTVQSLLLFWDDANDQAGGGSGDIRHCDIGQAPQWSYVCTSSHEHAHYNDICQKWYQLAASAKARIEALSLPPTEPYCSAAQAGNVLMPEALAILDQLHQEILDYGEDPERETTAYGDEVACLEGRINSICQSLPPGTCPACGTLPF